MMTGKTILVTGGIASGKSEVCRYLEILGYKVYYSDSRVKSLYESDPGLVGRLEAACGLPFSDWSRIFEDSAARLKLEAVLYPVLLEDFRLWREDIPDKYAFFESAIALEKPVFKDVFDGVIGVVAPLESRLARNPKTASRLSAQNINLFGADVVITNDGSISDLHKKVKTSLLQIIK